MGKAKHLQCSKGGICGCGYPSWMMQTGSLGLHLGLCKYSQCSVEPCYGPWHWGGGSGGKEPWKPEYPSLGLPMSRWLGYGLPADIGGTPALQGLHGLRRSSFQSSL